ncbi:hypothetical protein [Aliarcobacter butzleri]|uniref:hypothetical protein n=1 Tax=Aliarcobacter butzleri TaxID=28197 RepID=UPI0021B1BE9A|nr:hypothetical protein [Aliarcobacter butzleri]MCT7614731.1 hypothetical protein [Aliarcobacter butzleri]
MDLNGVLTLIVLPLVVGAIGSIIASYIFRSNTSKQIPSILVGKDIIKSDSGRENSLLIKIINKTKRDVINIQTMILGVKYRDPDEKKLKITTVLAERDIPYLAKDDGVVFGDNVISLHLYPINKHISFHNDILNYDELLLFIKAEDPYNNAFAVVHKNYNLEKDVKGLEYTFHENDSLTAIKKHI